MVVVTAILTPALVAAQPSQPNLTTQINGIEKQEDAPCEHGVETSICSICIPGFSDPAENPRRFREVPSVSCSTASTTVTLSSPAVSRTAGFEFATVKTQNLVYEISRNAEITYNANQYARLSSRAPGVIVKVLKDLGDRVEEGEVIAIIDSMSLGSAKADLLQATELLALWQANAEREQSLMQKGASTERAVLEAKTSLAEARISVSRARQHLLNLGLNKNVIAKVIKDSDTGSMLEITAPFSGKLLDRSAVMGEVVDENDMLFTIADTSLMWAMIDLTEADLAVVQKGQRIEFRLDSYPNRSFPGTLTWISTQLNQKTRTIRARTELDNGGQMLKAFMFGHAKINTGGGSKAVTVPKDAVQWEGCCNVAFIRANEEGTIFQPTRLTLGFDTGDHYEVLSGLTGSETVVTKGSYILKNEILKDAVGAGCCEVDHLSD